MAGKYYYNGVLLPEIPADVLAEYPYVMIGRPELSRGIHQILASKQPMYFKTTVSQIKLQNSDPEPYLYCSFGGDSWTAGESDDWSWSVSESRVLIWSNHDIPNGSADAAEIYFYGSEPIPEYVPSASNTYYQIGSDRLTGIANQVRRLTGTVSQMTLAQIQSALSEASNAVAETAANSANYAHIIPASITGDRCYYNDELLPGFPVEILKKYPYVILMKQTGDAGYYRLMFTTKPCYVADGAITPDAGSLGLRYMVELASAETAAEWVFHSLWNGSAIYSNALSDTRTVEWSNYDIPNGSPDAEDVYLYGSVLVPAEQEVV